jgi:hypothetical protein
MRYAYTVPAGWSRSPFPPPQQGIYLRAPVSTPSPEGASILLLDAVAPAGSLEDHLQAMVEQGCEGARIMRTGKPSPVTTTAGYRGLRVQLTARSEGREEIRVFVLVDAGPERLPLAFVGGARSLPLHEAALDGLIASIGPLELPRELYRSWTE